MKQRIEQSQLAVSDQELAERARDATAHAYAPYSGFAVGAAVRTRSGTVYVGSNLENAAYGVTMCAEVAALTAANSAGDFEIAAIAVSGHRFIEPPSSSAVVTPCGRCRQIIAEAGQIIDHDVRVLSCNGDLSRIEVAPISELLPDAFGPASLGLVREWPPMRAALAGRLKQLKAR